MNYLPVSVYANRSLSDSSVNGVSLTHFNNLVVACEDGFMTAENVARRGAVIIEIVPAPLAHLGHPSIARPTGEHDQGRGIFGGNFLFSSDSRFGAKYGHSPIAIHDRFEV